MNIAILGYGTVGKNVEILCQENNITVSHILMRTKEKAVKENMTADINDILNDEKVDCLVECMGGIEPAYTYLREAILKGKHIITSNKKMLADKYGELSSLAKENNVSLLFSSACGGGIPFIKELASIKDTDIINSFTGIMNGTSNYILDMMDSNNVSFTDALKRAQELGYAESDPSDDIDGIDTANKTILAAGIAFGYKFNLDDLFIKGIRYIDETALKYCKNHDLRCVLLGKGKRNGKTITLSVMPTFVNKNKTLGNIHLNNNCFIINSKNLAELTLIGQGAGGIPTASNVIRDIKMLNSPYKVDIKDVALPDYKTSLSTYYIRTNNPIDENLLQEKIEKNIYISKKITIESLIDIIKGDESAFVAEVEND